MDTKSAILLHSYINGRADVPIAHDFQSNSFSVKQLASTSSESGGNIPSVYGSDCVEVLNKENYFEDGYQIRHERVGGTLFGNDTIDMEVAYNYEGDYIGDRGMAQMLARLGIKAERASDSHKVCSIGYSEKSGKYYGWSHRAIFGFPIGYKDSDTEQEITSFEEQREKAINFAQSVSSSPITQDDARTLRSISHEVDPVNFDTLAWYRFKGKRAKEFKDVESTKGGIKFEIYLEPEDIFGIAYNKEKDIVYLMDGDVEVVWDIPVKTIEAFLKRCKGFGGKVNKVKVTKGNGNVKQIVVLDLPTAKPKPKGKGKGKDKAETPMRVGERRDEFEFDLDDELSISDIMEEHKEAFSADDIQRVRVREEQEEMDEVRDADELELDMEDDFDDDILDGGEESDGYDYGKSKRRKTKAQKMQDFLGEEEAIDDDVDDDISPTDSPFNPVRLKETFVYGFAIKSHATDTVLIGFDRDKEQSIDNMDIVSQMGPTIGNTGRIYTVPTTNVLYKKFLTRKRQRSLYLEIIPNHVKALEAEAEEVEEVSLRPDIKHESGTIEAPRVPPKLFQTSTILHPNNRLPVYRELIELIVKREYFTKTFVLPDTSGLGKKFHGIKNRAAEIQNNNNLSNVQNQDGKKTKINPILARLPYIELVGKFDSHKVIIEGKTTLRRIS